MIASFSATSPSIPECPRLRTVVYHSTSPRVLTVRPTGFKSTGRCHTYGPGRWPSRPSRLNPSASSARSVGLLWLTEATWCSLDNRPGAPLSKCAENQTESESISDPY